ncbi:hypothetical protein D3C75_783780 [compost metagenome]
MACQESSKYQWLEPQVQPGNLKCRHTGLCPGARRSQERALFLQAGFPGPDGDGKKYRHIQGPCVSGFGQGLKSDIYVNPNHHKGPPTWYSQLWTK